MNSLHWTEERTTRAALIAIIGEGQIVKAAVVDRGHINGPEIHLISDTGIISIYNKLSGKMVTQLIARPGQIRRYYVDEEPPVALIKIAAEHVRLGYNLA